MRVVALCFAILLGSTPVGATQEGVPAVAGEYLVYESSDPRLQTVNASWSILTDDRAGNAVDVAADLSRELGVRVIPNILVPLASDPRFDEQWHLENTGQTGGTVGADIDSPEAWTRATGDSVLIAMIDSGADLTHPDLVSQLWSNPGEVAGNGIDDDNNGYIDDIVGWDFVGGDAEPMDTSGHGTAVTGVAAAALNGEGTVGIAPNATVMVLRACTSSCPMSALVAAFDYAVANGADIINMSLGGSGAFFDPLGDSIEAAPGVLVVAAAGNSGFNSDESGFLPAAFPYDNIISVASSDHDDLLSDFSNYGLTTVDLVAPGDSLLAPVLGDYGLVSGTSFASPLTAGVAALVLELRPDLQPVDVRDLILAATDPTPVATETVTGGRLNAAEATLAASAPVAIPAVTLESPNVPSIVTLDGSLSWDPLGDIVQYEWIIDGQLAGSSRSIDVLIEDHLLHTVGLTVTDDTGLTDSAETLVDLNVPPVIVWENADQIGVAPFRPALAFTTADADGDDLTASWKLNGESSVEPADLGIGSYSIQLTVADSTSEVDDTIVVFVGAPFDDIDSGVFRDDILWASATGVTFGCTSAAFCPDDPITRGQAAAMLTRWLNLPNGPDAFADDDGHLFEADINAIATAGISFGCGTDAYCPNDAISRGEWAAFLARALDLAPGPDAFDDDTTSPFEPDINAAAAVGITKGCNPPVNDQYCPDRTITRAEAVATIHRVANS